MPTITAVVAITRDDKILLIKRDDFAVWSLPGGSVENGESLPEAAIREVKEETGLEVELKALIGIYSRLGVLPDDYAVLFSGVQAGGEIRTQPGETIEARYFGFDHLPDEIVPWYRRRIQDVREASGAAKVVTQCMSLPEGRQISMKDIVAIRQSPPEERAAAFWKIIQQATFHEEEAF
jgi:ADP-ribose pyrophosphatase YjhB (NUDIX family)